jgi:hypothetical protein
MNVVWWLTLPFRGKFMLILMIPIVVPFLVTIVMMYYDPSIAGGSSSVSLEELA